jgi:hypothetical protein
MSNLPEPPVPADLDLRGFEYMPLKVQHLRDSDFTAIASAEEFRAGVLLWAASWHQVPASSLPSDDRLLCKLAGLGRDMKTWLLIKETALRGFSQHSDGLLYHPVIADLALNAMDKKRGNKTRTENATKARLARLEASRLRHEKNSAREVHVTSERDVVRDDRNIETSAPRDVEKSARDHHVTSTNRDREGIDREDSPSSPPGDGLLPLGLLPTVPEPNDDVKEAFTRFNEVSKRIGGVVAQNLDAERRRGISARLGECDGLPGWIVALEKVEASPFLRGERNDFRVSIDFMTQKKSFKKLMEGFYDDRTKPGTVAGGKANTLAAAQQDLRDRLAGYSQGAADD